MELTTVAGYAALIFFDLYAFATVACSAVAALQERKIWAPPNLPSLSVFAVFKVFLFNIFWISICSVGCLLVFIKHILTGGSSDLSKDCNLFVEKYAAVFCSSLVGNVKVKGLEHLPPDDQVPAPVYVANHASQIDVAVVYFIARRFRWIAKKSVLYLPGVGATMWFGNHVLIDRVKGKNKKSVSNLFEKSNQAVQSGIPMFLFPQGTRVMSKRLPFKDGAFIIAQTNKSLLVPISLEIPMTAWETWYPLIRTTVPEVVITIHKPIKVTGEEDRQKLKQQCFDTIYSCLPPIWEKEE